MPVSAFIQTGSIRISKEAGIVTAGMYLSYGVKSARVNIFTYYLKEVLDV